MITPEVKPTIITKLRIKRLQMNNWSFGCEGTHTGYGSPECPRELHHHHDIFCDPPTNEELESAGIIPSDFKLRSRA